MLFTTSGATARLFSIAVAGALVFGFAPAPAQARVDPTPSPDFSILATWSDVDTGAGLETDYLLVQDVLGIHRFAGTSWTEANLSDSCAPTFCAEVEVGQVSADGIVPVWFGNTLWLYGLADNAPIAGSEITLPDGATGISANASTAVFQVGDEWRFQDLAGGADEALVADPDRLIVIPGLEAGSSYPAPVVAMSVRTSTIDFTAPDATVATSVLEVTDPYFREVEAAGDTLLARTYVDPDTVGPDAPSDWIHLVQLGRAVPNQLSVDATGQTLRSFTPGGVLLSAESTPGALVFQPIERPTGGYVLGAQASLDTPAGLDLQFAGVQTTGTPLARFIDAHGVVGLTRLNYTIAKDAGTGADVATLSLTELFRFKVTGSKPTISGVAAFGQRLTGQAGAWEPSHLAPSGYQWYADGQKIWAATAVTYTITEDEVGKQITFEVTGEASGYQTDVQLSAATDKVSDVEAGTVSITGSAVVGQTLRAVPANWPVEAYLSYQWLNGGRDIPAATQASYQVAWGDALDELSVRVTAHIQNHSSISRTAEAVRVPQMIYPLLSTPKPKIKGKAKVGKTLVAVPGIWSPKPVQLSYEWLRNGVAIRKATKVKYKLTKADRRARITVSVTGAKAGYRTVVKTSSATAKVK